MVRSSTTRGGAAAAARGWWRTTPVAAALAATAALTALVGCGDDAVEGTPTAGATAPSSASAGPAAAGEPEVVTGSGDVQDAVTRYRTLLGPDNGGGPEGDPNGRREVNWDGVPDEFAAPNALPGDFFNAPVAPRARGLFLTTTGDRLTVSADDDNPTGTPVRFADVNPSYAEQFRAFSAQRLFSPQGTNVVDVTFLVPGTTTPAVVRGFGAVYTDVDGEHAAEFEFFDASGTSLGTHTVPVSGDGLSFLGIAYPEPVVARVRVVYGNAALGPDDSAQYDVAVMDDFIFGEPRAQ
ncbi:hypothetical protein I6A84_33440 [Frankia sp. CNm7]|uniref:Uncharacterized protein n=1 Tax=Frankia nepalensis TaxID=1836974 RepID=A0A937RG37_9ACTN|nr:hypothetical protein [Frankia nepalensis]MBL7502614.1 hypothetical protein [Frankia nepalensis]MBL7514792.1 hypothetical protein [Frankia nepalensis]MBL7522861.1 hypothetical protein [Frankia nepalensis]MBL7629557.1 hypothetical protein [Frankia nepalensis]